MTKEIIEEVKNDICDNYCKWPEQWDETETVELFSNAEIKETMIIKVPLCESDICRNCPLNRL